MEDLLKVGVITTTHGVRGRSEGISYHMIRSASWILNMCFWMPAER